MAALRSGALRARAGQSLPVSGCLCQHRLAATLSRCALLVSAIVSERTARGRGLRRSREGTVRQLEQRRSMISAGGGHAKGEDGRRARSEEDPGSEICGAAEQQSGGLRRPA